MKKHLLLIVIATIFTSCKDEPIIELNKLNGYWEIKNVELKDGSQKDYVINPIIDHYKLEDSIGYKQKLQPQFDGTYVAISEAEKFVIQKDSLQLFLKYQTKFSKWQEEVLQVSDSILVIKNEQEIIYTFKKPIPFTIK